MNEWLLILLFLLPMVGGLMALYVKRAVIPIIAAACTFLVALGTTLSLNNPIVASWKWTSAIVFQVYVDRVALVLITVVTFVALLVHIFSVKYMEDDDGKFRYFAKLGVFVSSMIGLLMADHLILLFFFWELVGVSSYLLIGFWYSKEGVPAAAKTAFMVNRVADACLLAGILLVYHQSGTWELSALAEKSLFLPSLLIAIGAFGKSAQFPFSGWLIKAMAGPTPVSALIHAATMVAAGVYLLFRFAPFMHSDALLVVALVGTITAFYGALSAISQFDIKKVLAYSTISQLGYMMIGVGVGARDAALFHLVTHAFFKAGLFLAAAAIIHFLHHTSDKDAQDMRFMGGLREKLPWTFRSFLICGLALAGAPFFSGFLSKDAIIIAAWSWADANGTWSYLVPDLAFLTALLTAFYVGKTLFLVFFGTARTALSTDHKKEHLFIYLPLVVLGILSFWVFYNINPLGHTHWLMKYWGGASDSEHSIITTFALILSIVLSLAGLVLAYAFFKPSADYIRSFDQQRNPQKFLGRLTFHGFYLTSLYELVGRTTFRSGSFTQKLDERLIDPLINLGAICSVVFSKVLALVDRFLVDGPVNGLAMLSGFTGKRLAGLSARDLQVQLLWLLFIIILILALIIFF